MGGKQEELSSKIKEVEHLMKIAETLASPKYALGEKLDICLKTVLDQFNAGRGSILLIDQEKNEMEIRAATDPKLLGLRQPLDSDSPSAWVAKNAEPLNVNDIKDENRFSQSDSKGYSGDSFLCYPIKGYKKVLGVFSVTNKKDGGFSKKDEDALFYFINRIAVTIESATLNEELKKAFEELKKLEELKNNLTHMIVHDLKGPIAEIKANLSMLSSAQLEEFQKEVLLTSQIGTENLLEMVLEILDVSKMEEGKYELSLKETDLQDIANKKTAQLGALLKLENKFLETSFEGESHIAKADEAVVTRILQNFLTNAINYSPEGETITIGLENAGQDKIRVSVRDKGPGIPEESRDKIFQKFGTVTGDDRKSKHSTGLGLTFCKMAVEAHGGEIGVENHPEGGSIFFFTLPRA